MGDTREEVYEQCKSIIDAYWRPEYEQYGTPQELFIKSVTFIEAKLSDNIKLMSSDPTYLANLVNQSEEQRARDLDGNWKYKSAGDDIIKMAHMEAMYSNSIQIGDGVRGHHAMRHLTAETALSYFYGRGGTSETYSCVSSTVRRQSMP